MAPASVKTQRERRKKVAVAQPGSARPQRPEATLAPAAQRPAGPRLPQFAHAALRMPDSGHSEPRRHLPPHGPPRPHFPSPPETAFRWRPSCRQPQQAGRPSYHDGPHGPHASFGPGLGAHDLTGRAIPRLLTTEGTRKRRSGATDLRCHPAAVCGGVHRGHQAALGRPRSTLKPWPLKEVTGKRSRREAWPLHRSRRYSSGASWPAGGKRDGEERRRWHAT